MTRFILPILLLSACATTATDTADEAPRTMAGSAWALQSWEPAPCGGEDLGEGCLALDLDGSVWWSSWTRGDLSTATEWEYVGEWTGGEDEYRLCGMALSVSAWYDHSVQTDPWGHLYPCPLSE